MRITDVLYAVPNIMVAVIIVSLFGASTLTLLIALCVYAATNFARITRASVMAVAAMDEVEKRQMRPFSLIACSAAAYGTAAGHLPLG